MQLRGLPIGCLWVGKVSCTWVGEFLNVGRTFDFNILLMKYKIDIKHNMLTLFSQVKHMRLFKIIVCIKTKYKHKI